MFSNRRCVLLAAAASLCVCGVVQANSIAPFVWFWPGVLHVAFFYSFPATLLAAVIERDFVRREGESTGNLVLSLRANLLSTFAGILLIPVAQVAIYSVAILLWRLASFALSCGVEIAYLKWIDRRIQAWRLVQGNAISAGTLMIVPWIAEAVKEARPEWAWNLRDHENEMLWIAFVVSASILAIAWILPARFSSESSASDRIPRDDRNEVAISANRQATAKSRIARST